MPGCPTIASPMAGPPVTTLNTPSGNPASMNNSPSRITEYGASSGALATMQLPAARAGATTIVTANSGPFHGMIAPITP